MATQFKGVKVSELFAAPPEVQEVEVDRLFQAAISPTCEQLNQQKAALDYRIKRFERRYEISSKAMRQQFRLGRIRETAEICSWLMLLKAKEDFDGESPPITDQFGLRDILRFMKPF
jgi:hypothetical protein